MPLSTSEAAVRALKEEMNSAYRMHAQRLADLAFAQILERLYKQEIAWKEIERTWQNKSVVLLDEITVAIEPLGSRQFIRRATMHSVGKKDKEGKQWHLTTFRITIKSPKKEFAMFRKPKPSQSSKVFTYQVLIGKIPLLPATPVQLETPPPKEVKTP